MAISKFPFSFQLLDDSEVTVTSLNGESSFEVVIEGKRGTERFTLTPTAEDYKSGDVTIKSESVRIHEAIRGFWAIYHD